MTLTNNRTQILRVALELFSARGYDATGVKEIVEAVGVTKPTLYHYFGSKRGLLGALLEEHASGFLASLRAVAYGRNLPMTLQHVTMLYLTFAAEQPAFYRFLLSLQFVPPENEAYEVAASLFSEQRLVLERLFEAASRDHGNMRGRQHRYAYSLLGVLNGYALLVLQGQLEPTAALGRDIVQQFSHGIYS